MRLRRPFPAEPRQHRLDFDIDGRDWPNRAASRFVEAGGLRWHVQIMGRGPVLLLLHGTGASTHSWRDLAPLLASDFTIVAPDLPGHAFTDPLPTSRMSLQGMSQALGHLLASLRLAPDLVAGHSAGAALAVRMRLNRLMAPRVIVAFNGAFLPFEGLARHLFPSIARLLFVNPVTPRIFAMSANRRSVSRMLAGTGSVIDRTGVDLYLRLFRNVDHVANVLTMMANWDLEKLERDIRRLDTPLVLVAAAGDKAVPPETAERIKARLPAAEIVKVRRLGHLAHEEDPAQFAAILREAAVRHGVISSAQ